MTDQVPSALLTRAQPSSASPTIRRSTSARILCGSRTITLSFFAVGPRTKRPSEAARASGMGRIPLHPVVAAVRQVEIASAIHSEAGRVIDLADRCAGGGDH